MRTFWSRTWLGRPAAYLSGARIGRCALAAIAVAIPWSTMLLATEAQADGGSASWSGYQRKGTYAAMPYGNWHGGQRHFAPQQVAAGWFQRPYPYHLDYYRMRYGGSYAPYFGNLYGPPHVYVAPSYYGSYGTYDGGYGYPAYGYPGGPGPNGVEQFVPPAGSTPAEPPAPNP